MKTVAGSLSFVLAFAVLACGGGSSQGLQNRDVPSGQEFGYETKEVAQDMGGERPDCPGKLSFVEPMDDAQKPTKGATVFNVVLSFAATRDLKVAYKQCDSPIVDASVNFTIQNDPDGLCSLASDMAYTGDDGIASDKLANVKQKVGQFQVKVCVEGAPDVPCLYFNVVVDPKGAPPLTVTFAEYKGSYPLIDTADVLLFKQGVNGKPKCADLKLDALPTAQVAQSGLSLSGAAVFTKLPNLEAEKKQTYTIIGLAHQGANGPTQAWACEDVKGVVEWGGKQYVELVLKDLAPRIVGSYEITSTFDLVSGLPPAVADVVYTITGFFQNPSAQIMLLACKLGGSSLEDFCGYMFADPSDPDIDELTGTGQVVFDIVNAILIGLLDQYCPYEEDPELCLKILFTGKDVSEILTKFQLISTFTFGKEPDEFGILAESSCQEVWHSVRLRWTLGKDCPPDDDNCGWQKFSFSAVPGIENTITGQFSAKLEPPIPGNPAYKDAWRLTIDPHHLELKYGALVNFALEKWLLPMLFGDGSDGLPAVDSYEALVGSLLAGRACLQTMDCCEQFAKQVAGSTGSVTENLVEGACEALIQTGANWLRSQLVGLDATPENFTLGTFIDPPPPKPCAIFDKNKDMKFDAFGAKDAPCLWDAKLVIGGATYAPKGEFYGNRK